MNTDALFKELEPPRGGAERFAQRLDAIAAPQGSPRTRVLAVAAAIAAVALVTVMLLRQSPNGAPPEIVVASPPEVVIDAPPNVDVYNAHEFDRLLGRVAPPAELMVMVNAKTADITEIPSTNQKVRIYQIN